MPARSAHQILSIKANCTFLFFKFLITGLCNSSPNSLLESSVLQLNFILLPEVQFSNQKIYKPLK